MEHVRVGEDEVVAAADRRPLLARRVAVVDRLAQAGRAQLRQLARLVLGQRLGRVEVERAALRLAGDPVEHRQVEGEALARGGAAGDHQVGVRRRSRRPRAGACRGTRCRPAAAPRRGRGRARRAARPAAPAAPPRRSRRRSARRAAPDRSRSPTALAQQAAAARHQAALRWPAARSAPATRIACSELRSWMRRMSAPSRTARATAATVPHSRSPARQPLLPGPGQHGADEVLARERDVERQAERAQLAEPPQDLQVLLGAEVEVESGVDRDLLLGDAKLPGQLDSPLEPGLAGGRRRRRTRARAGRPAAAPRCASARSRSRSRRPARTSPPSRRRCR